MPDDHPQLCGESEIDLRHSSLSSTHSSSYVPYTYRSLLHSPELPSQPKPKLKIVESLDCVLEDYFRLIRMTLTIAPNSRRNAAKFDFAASGGQLDSSFDDGHIPENLRTTPGGGTTTLDFPTKLVRYPYLFDNKPARVDVFWDTLDERLVDHFYDRTVQSKVHSSWGSYVTLPQVLDYWETNDENNSIREDDDDDSRMEVKLVADFLSLAVGRNSTIQPNQCLTQDDDSSFNNPTTTTTTEPLWNLAELTEKAHGVAIWALAAAPGSQVPYHLDYAEQVRYETNLIVPPLLAGTLHCSRAKIEGGAFQVSLDGLDHYQKHGYKAKLQPLRPKDEESSSMKEIPYRYNQVMCHVGHLPHASSRIDSITPLLDQDIPGDSSSSSENHQHPMLRVIVGFNVFAHDIGPTVQQAPEHSDAFRRKIQVQRKLLQSMNQNKALHLNLQAIQQNKPLSKLLVLAKREKVKQELKKAQEHLAKRIPELLPATVQSLMNQLSSSSTSDDGATGGWPNPVDVQVYLHHKVLEGTYQVVKVESPIQAQGPAKNKDLISVDTVIELPVPEQRQAMNH